MLLPLFHLSVVALNSFSLWYDQNYVDLPLNENVKHLPLKSRILFLTIWCFILQTIYFSVALLNDLFGSAAPAPRKPPLLRKLKDYLFSISFALALYVSTAFWGIYFYDKDLIFPERIAKVFPVWMNHAMHTFVAVFILFELIVTHRNYPSRKAGFAGVAAVTLSYTAWFNFVYFKTGYWVYPILEVLNWPTRFVFVFSSVLFGLGLYVVGEKLHGFVTPKGKKESSTKSKKR